MKKSIAIDMDGVIADVEAQLLKFYQAHSGISLSKEDILGTSEFEALPDGLIDKFIHQKGFFRTAPVMYGAIEALITLSQKFDIYIVSAAMEFPQSLTEKREWLSEHFPFISWRNIVFCGNKSIIKTDYMIDDHPKNLDYCVGKPLMFAAFHNYGQNHHPRFKDWNSIVAFLKNELASE